MPSLPPSSWTTTSTRPSRSAGIAWAVRARKAGMAGARAKREDVLRKPRRVSMEEDLQRKFLHELGLGGAERQGHQAAGRVSRQSRSVAQSGQQALPPAWRRHT